MPRDKTVYPFDKLDDAVNEDAYRWLESNAPGYLSGIEEALAKGATPSDVRRHAFRKLGSDREGLALRCHQAAQYIQDWEMER